MPYSSNDELPERVRSRYSSNCQSVWRHTWNSVYEKYHDESRAFASATGQANKCQGSKTMDQVRTAVAEPTFKIFAPLLKATGGSGSLDGKKRLHGIASSTIKDRHGDTMSLSALADMEHSANNNLTIFLNHSYTVPEDVAGYVERAQIRQHPNDGDVHDLILDIVVNETNDRAVRAWEAIQNGTQLGLSIGAMIPEGGAIRNPKTGTYQIDHVNLLETSVVGVPANPRSWVEYAVKSLANGLVERSDGEVGVLIDPDEEPGRGFTEIEEAVLHEHPGHGEVMEGIEVPADGTMHELVVKAPLSSESRNALPDSAFACPGERKYPHHTKSGAVDKSHLRNALSRCGDSSNDQCGCAHIRAHAKKLGMGDSKESYEDLLVFALTTDHGEDHFDESHFELEAEELEHDDPLEEDEDLEGFDFTTPASTTNATVSITTPFADINIDTGNRGGTKAPAGEASQEAPVSAPETEDQGETKETSPWAGILPVSSALADMDIKTALELLEPSVVASLHNSTELLKAITRELIETKEALATKESEYAALEEMTKQVVAQTGRILDNLSNTPVGRRAVVREANEQFSSLKSVYSEEFLDLLKKRS